MERATNREKGTGVEGKKSGSHWGNSLFGLIIGGLVVAAVFSDGKQIITYSLWLALFAVGYVVRWVVLKVWAQYKTPAVVASTVDCVVEQQEQPVSIPVPVTAKQPVQQINKTVVASVVAGVITAAVSFYLFAVVSANQAYDQAVVMHDQAVQANKKERAEYEKKRAEERNKVAEAGAMGNTRRDYSSNMEFDFSEFEDLPCCTDTENILKKAEIAKRYPLASLFNKADVE